MHLVCLQYGAVSDVTGEHERMKGNDYNTPALTGCAQNNLLCCRNNHSDNKYL